MTIKITVHMRNTKDVCYVCKRPTVGFVAREWDDDYKSNNLPCGCGRHEDSAHLSQAEVAMALLMADP